MTPKRVAVALSAALVVGVVIAVIAIQSDPDAEPVASAPSGTAGTTSTTTSTSTSSSSTSTSTATTLASTSTSVPPEAPIAATVDLAAAVPRLEPQLIASYPIVAPGDLFPTAYATTASGDRLVLLDAVTGVVRFIDGKGMEITQYPTAVPTIGAQVFIAGFFAVGPDDILYVSEAGTDTPAIVAYGRTGDSYVEVASVSHGVGDGIFELDRAGVMVLGETEPVMKYVGVDGQPSGATVDVDDLVFSSEPDNVYSVQRGGHTWTVTYVFPPDSGLPPSDRCALCASAFRGPRDTVVLVNKSPAAGGDLQTKLTLLSDQVSTYDVDWEYIGLLGTKMIFARLDQDSIDLGSIEM